MVTRDTDNGDHRFRQTCKPNLDAKANIRARYKAQGIELPAVVPVDRITQWAIMRFVWRPMAVFFASRYERRFRHWHAGKFWLYRLRDDDIKTLFSQVTPGTKGISSTPRLKSLPNQTVRVWLSTSAAVRED